MRRVLEFLRWKANWWEEWLHSRDVRHDEALREALAMYACCQRDLQAMLKSTFCEMWMKPLEEIDAEVAWNMEKTVAGDIVEESSIESETEGVGADGDGSDVEGSDDEA
ncbi:uncharacterized protein ARMOST_11662 [Armillaria ostoyae]|uniref:Uncharacterized protein n=1 Tax=Armillaria ostoyae TaxID=47428 RepID=A0A284RHR5_ARMOS|nr:uncharacterized protein ARMOST_11662 [Armillaria ostoyae]